MWPLESIARLSLQVESFDALMVRVTSDDPELTEFKIMNTSMFLSMKGKERDEQFARIGPALQKNTHVTKVQIVNIGANCVLAKGVAEAMVSDCQILTPPAAFPWADSCPYTPTNPHPSQFGRNALPADYEPTNH
jgi:hypothetical protein